MCGVTHEKPIADRLEADVAVLERIAREGAARWDKLEALNAADNARVAEGLAAANAEFDPVLEVIEAMNAESVTILEELPPVELDAEDRRLEAQLMRGL